MCARWICELAILGMVAGGLSACASAAGPTAANPVLPTVGPTAVAATTSPISSFAASLSSQGTAGASSPASAAAAPFTLDVGCTGTGTTVATDRVAAQPDGVHFHVRSVEAGRAFEIDGVGGDNAPAPEGAIVWPVPPGDIRIWCGPTEATDSDWIAVRVVDPLGIYVPVELACQIGAHGSIDYGAGTRGERGDPVAIAGHHLHGLRRGDTVELAGYPKASDRKVRVMRDGSIALVATYLPDGHGGWLLGGTDTCDGGDISLGS